MAEVRKHRPRSAGSIGDQVRAAVPTGPAPVEPGSVPPPTYDPFVDAEADRGVSFSAANFAVSSLATDGWFALGDEALEVLKTNNHTEDPQPDQQD